MKTLGVCSLLLAAGALLAQPTRPVARSTASAGNAEQGKAIFEGKGACLNCHAVKGAGSHQGPDLTNIGLERSRAQLEASLTGPEKETPPKSRTIHVVTKDGQEITGELLNEDTLSLLILDAHNEMRYFSKSDLKGDSPVTKRVMPSYKDKLTAAELADVVSYLSSLKGAESEAGNYSGTHSR